MCGSVRDVIPVKDNVYMCTGIHGYMQHAGKPIESLAQAVLTLPVRLNVYTFPRFYITRSTYVLAENHPFNILVADLATALFTETVVGVQQERTMLSIGVSVLESANMRQSTAV